MNSQPILFLIVQLSLHAASADPVFSLAPHSPFKIPGGGHNLIVGEANGDGKPDLIASGGTRLTVLRGDGRGGFESETNMPIALPHAVSEMAVGDFNRDGHLDWAGAHHDHYDVIVLLGKGTGQFHPAPGSPFTARQPGKRPHTHALVAGDVNNDGFLDLVTANSEDGDVSILLGDGRGGFAQGPGSPFPVGPNPYPIALADLDGDRDLDIVAPNSGPQSRTLTALLGDGRGGFTKAPSSPFPTAPGPFFVAIGDLNKDQKPDLIATHDDKSLVTFLLGNGQGDFKPAPSSPIDLRNRAWTVVLADMNNDGNLDLVTAGQNAVVLMLGDGKGGLKPASGSPFNSGGKGSWRPFVADFNADSKPDIIVGNVETGDISVLLAK